MHSIYIARQPLVDNSDKVMAYELLFRDSDKNYAQIELDEVATCKVLMNAINDIGLNKLIGKKKGVLNFNHVLMESRAFELLDPKYFMIEILAHSQVNEEFVKSVKECYDLGFVIGLDDFDFEEDLLTKFKDIRPYLHFLKIEMRTVGLRGIRNNIDFIRRKEFEFIAERVETEEMYLALKDLGFRYYQGFYFGQPEIQKGRTISPQLKSIFEILKLYDDDDVEVSTLSDAMKHHPEVAVLLLKYLNSASIGVHHRMHSINQAVSLLGVRNLKKWLMVLMYTCGKKSEFNQVILETACWRGYFMERLFFHKKKEGSDEAFFVGMLSLLSVIYKVEPTKIFEDLGIDKSLQKSILEHFGDMGTSLKLAELLQKDDWNGALPLIKQMNLDEKLVRNASVEANHWVHENCDV